MYLGASSAVLAILSITFCAFVILSGKVHSRGVIYIFLSTFLALNGISSSPSLSAKNPTSDPNLLPLLSSPPLKYTSKLRCQLRYFPTFTTLSPTSTPSKCHFTSKICPIYITQAIAITHFYPNTSIFIFSHHTSLTIKLQFDHIQIRFTLNKTQQL